MNTFICQMPGQSVEFYLFSAVIFVDVRYGRSTGSVEYYVVLPHTV